MELYQPIQVLDKGFVRLDGHLCDDLSVINSARVSFGKRHEVMEKGDDRLIDFLIRKKHGSPFEHNLIRLHIKAPLFVVQEWLRHRISSFNQVSLRYTELSEPEFYIPDLDNVRTRVGKPGDYSYIGADATTAMGFRVHLIQAGLRSVEAYKKALENGIAPEQARLFLAPGLYTEFYWSVNARSLMNFLNLRNHGEAQQEIRAYAEVIENIWGQLMPVTAAAFVKNDRRAP